MGPHVKSLNSPFKYLHNLKETKAYLFSDLSIESLHKKKKPNTNISYYIAEDFFFFLYLSMNIFWYVQ